MSIKSLFGRHGTLARFVPQWSQLRVLGANRVLRTTYVWIFIVPLLAKCLEHISSPLTLYLFGATVQLTVALPFSWTMFFFGSLFATIANALFVVSCPPLIKNYRNATEYVGSGRGKYHLKQDLVAALVLCQSKMKASHARQLLKEFCVSFCEPMENETANRLEVSDSELKASDIAAIVAHAEIVGGGVEEGFVFMYAFLEHCRRLSRIVCGVLYSVAMLCFSVNILQNVVFVLKKQWS